MWITAARQNQGRGRRGRAWETGEGNLAASLLLVTQKPTGEAAQISFVAALAAYDLAAAFVPADNVALKWPNDLMIDRRKAGGILVESGTLDGQMWLVVGMGINLARPPLEAQVPATALSLHITAPPPVPIVALEVLSAAFAYWQGIWERSGFEPIAQAWTQKAMGLGEACTARLPTETVTGIAEGLDIDGALRLKPADGTVRRITAGDVFFGAT